MVIQQSILFDEMFLQQPTIFILKVKQLKCANFERLDFHKGSKIDIIWKPLLEQD